MQTREAYVRELIRRRYRRHADDGEWGGRARAVRIGYDPDRLDALPAAAVEKWAGCGNVIAGAPLAGVSVVVDLGAGAGVDGMLIAASPARPLVIVVDLSPEMLAAPGGPQGRLVRVAGDFERLPLPDGIADLVVANAALNLALDPDAAFAEAWRVLRPGGRLYICELVRDGELPPELMTDPLAWSASLGGVLAEDHLVAVIAGAGFEDVTVTGHRPFPPVVSVNVNAMKPASIAPATRGLHQ
jgi:SAM-dependent methyltransferase